MKSKTAMMSTLWPMKILHLLGFEMEQRMWYFVGNYIFFFSDPDYAEWYTKSLHRGSSRMAVGSVCKAS